MSSGVGNYRNDGKDAFGNPKVTFANFPNGTVTAAGLDTLVHEIGHTLGLKHPLHPRAGHSLSAGTPRTPSGRATSTGK